MKRDRSTPKKRKRPVEFNRDRFLQLLAEGNTAAFSAASVGVDRHTPYRYRDKDLLFAAAWKDAEEAGTQVMEQEAYRRATQGVLKPVVYQGKVVEVTMKNGKVVLAETAGAEKVPLMVREYADVLLIFLLKSRRPEVYRERIEATVRTPPIDPANLSDEELDAIYSVIAKHRGREVPAGGTQH